MEDMPNAVKKAQEEYNKKVSDAANNATHQEDTDKQDDDHGNVVSDVNSDNKSGSATPDDEEGSATPEVK